MDAVSYTGTASVAHGSRIPDSSPRLQPTGDL
jgi:hypothetical protein